MSDLAAFLTARLDEDYRAARAITAFDNLLADESGVHLTSARALREVEAKRKILAAYEATLPLAGKPDEPEWHIARRTALEHACTLLASAYDPAWNA